MIFRPRRSKPEQANWMQQNNLSNCSQVIFREVFCHVYDKIPGHTINEKIFRAIRNVEKCRKYVWIIVDDGERMLYNTKKNTEDLNTS